MSTKWHLSEYNISAKIPEEDRWVMVNTFKGTCTPLNAAYLYAMTELNDLDEDTPILKKLAKFGIITDIDERAALSSIALLVPGFPHAVNLTICPTLGCNFDCPYCFENHNSSKMDAKTMDGVIKLAEKMLVASGAKNLSVTWFGGEPLLACDVIESLSDRLIKMCEDRNIKYSAGIITNGYLLDQKTADVLEKAMVSSAQITLDGIGSTHDMTRHLAGGGATFDRITGNLRNVKIPFKVNIRHNLHTKNVDESVALCDYIKELADKSGNDLIYYGKEVSGNEVADSRGSTISAANSADCANAGLKIDAENFGGGFGRFCGANSLWNVCIDAEGRLGKCWEIVDKPEHSFGNVNDWNPMNPIASSSDPDNLTKYIITTGALNDAECLDCIWLPECRGGCCQRRLTIGKSCVPYKDDPESFVREVYAVRKKRLEQKKNKQ